MEIFKRRRQSISEPRGSKGSRGTKSEELSEHIRARGAISKECQSKRSHQRSYRRISEQEEPSLYVLFIPVNNPYVQSH